MENAGLATGIERYGVPTNPFWRGPLDPLRTPDETEQPQTVGGLARLADIRNYLERAADEEEPAFVLLSGTRKSGRTSICNHLLAHYRDKRGIAHDKFVVPKRDFPGRNPQVLFKKWIKSLYNELRSADVTPLIDGSLDLDEDIRMGTELTDPDTWEETAQFWMREVSRMLKSKGGGFGVCIENVEAPEVLQSIFSLFEEARTVVVLTVLTDTDGTAVRRQFRQRPTSGSAVRASKYPVVDLLPVAGSDASTLVQCRWDAVAHGLESPFDAEGLKTVFDELPRPTGRILRLTAETLDERVHGLGPGLPWPEARDELAFDAAELRNKIKWHDDRVPE